MFDLERRSDPNTEARFRAYYEAHYAALNRYVRRLSGDDVSAEDVTQEIFLQLWRTMASSGDPRMPRAWLYRVATNLVIDRKRKWGRTIAVVVPAPAALDETPSSEASTERTLTQRQLVRHVLQRLPEPMRQCLLLHHEGLTGKEIADVLGIKPSYVGTLVLRAHDRFRRECEALGGRHGLLG